jgi:2-(3-amino-3-carboxypropyl)histidine synthase
MFNYNKDRFSEGQRSTSANLPNTELDTILEVIKKRNAKIVGLQFPNGLKRRSCEIAREIESKTSAKTIISGNTCYGACDIDEYLRDLVDLLFHFGHAEMYPMKNVIFVEVRSDVDVTKVTEEAVKEMAGDCIGLITTVQHIDRLDEVRRILQDFDKHVVIGRGNSRIKYPGQVLGCNFSSARVECDELLFIGTGKFHPIGAAFATKKRVIAADPFLGVEVIDDEEIIRRRYATMAKALDARSFGILIGTKTGQRRIDLGMRLRGESMSSFDVQLIFMDEITNERLIHFDLDAFVNTACPRVAIDGRYDKPMLNPTEFEIIIGKRRWEEIRFDEY